MKSLLLRSLQNGGITIKVNKTEIWVINGVAEWLKITECTVYRLAVAKNIPAFKVGESWRFSRTDIDRWI